MIDVRLDINPVPKARPRTAGGRTWTPATTVQFQTDLRMLLRAARAVPRQPLEGPLEVVVILWRRCQSVMHAGDLDNLVKAVLDACNPSRDGGWPGLWRDDRQIRFLTAALVDAGPNVTGRVLLRARRCAPLGDAQRAALEHEIGYLTSEANA